jgi:hypothetical protein
MKNRKAVVPCWKCGEGVELHAFRCEKCGEGMPARGSPGGKVGIMWKTVVAVSDELGADPDLLEKSAGQYGLTGEELLEVIEVMRVRMR